MSVFIDTGVFYAQIDPSTKGHAAAKKALESILEGLHGRPYTSDYVVDEVYTLVQARTGPPNIARAAIDRILEEDQEPPFDLLRVSEPVFEAARDVLSTYEDHGLSFTDATTVALVDDNAPDHVLSFDEGFDGILPRISPYEVDHMPRTDG